MIKIGILGSTGYAGSELVRLLSSHPYAEIVFLDSRSYETKPYTDIYPHLESKEGIIKVQGIIADSKSGISGAGRNLSDANLFSQCNENIRAYSLCKHRHIPEIEEQLSLYADTTLTLQFTPHLIPMNRGILSTIYADMNKNLSCSEVYDLYSTYYSDEYFVRLLPHGKLPQTKAVSASNYCDIGFDIDKRTGKIIIVSAIDNLIKGASGQAVQNMNLMFGLEEHTGINQLPMWP